MVYIQHEPLYHIYLDLSKVYNYVEWEQTVKNIWGYGVGSQVVILLEGYWYWYILVMIYGGFQWDYFISYGGVIDTNLILPTILNIVVDMVAIHCLTWFCGIWNFYQSLVLNIRHNIIILYDEDGWLLPSDITWLKDNVGYMVGFF